jgi:hypothetical protein
MAESPKKVDILYPYKIRLSDSEGSLHFRRGIHVTALNKVYLPPRF